MPPEAFSFGVTVNKDLHTALCRGYLSLASALVIPIWRYEPMDAYVLEFPAGLITFPTSLVGNLDVPDYQGEVEKPSLEELKKRLENPLRFPLPMKETG